MKVLVSSMLLTLLATSPMAWLVREAENDPTASVCPIHGNVCCCPAVCLKQLKDMDPGHRACARPVREPDRLRIVSDCGAEPEGMVLVNLKAVFLPPAETGFKDFNFALPYDVPLRTPLVPPAIEDPPPRRCV